MPDWHAVIDNVQIRLEEIDDALASRIFDARILDVPFGRHSPSRTRVFQWQLQMQREGNQVLKTPQGLA